MKKVLGFGNALVDILIAQVKEETLQQLGMPKGSMTLIDEAKVHTISTLNADLKQKMATGGSAANTINGLANMGIETAFIGKVGNDKVGNFFKEDLIENKITPLLCTSKTPAGRSYVMVSPDSERTMATFLGASIELSSEDLKASMFDAYHYLYVEGYLVQNHKLIEAGMKLAKNAGLKIVLDLASFNVVEENLDFLHHLMTNYVHIVFANEEEAKSYADKAPEQALHDLSEQAELAIVKVGAKGAFLKRANEQVHVPAFDTVPVDTTGAGDLYAAGVLYGLINNHGLENCGKIGSILAGNVIQDYGAKMSTSTWNRIKEEVAKLKNC